MVHWSVNGPARSDDALHSFLPDLVIDPRRQSSELYQGTQDWVIYFIEPKLGRFDEISYVNMAAQAAQAANYGLHFIVELRIFSVQVNIEWTHLEPCLPSCSLVENPAVSFQDIDGICDHLCRDEYVVRVPIIRNRIRHCSCRVIYIYIPRRHRKDGNLSHLQGGRKIRQDPGQGCIADELIHLYIIQPTATHQSPSDPLSLCTSTQRFACNSRA